MIGSGLQFIIRYLSGIGILLQIQVHFAGAQPRQNDFVQLTRSQGLPHHTIFRMTQDLQGFMWFPTLEGLIRYDGYQFTMYRHDPSDPYSISPGFIYTVHAASDGMLWLGFEKNGLNRFDPATGQAIRYRHDPRDSTSLVSNSIYIIEPDPDGRHLWLGTGKGVERFDPQSGAFTHYRHDPDDSSRLPPFGAYDLFIREDGGLWVTGGRSLSRFDPATGRAIRYQHDPTDPYSLTRASANAVLEDYNGRVWVGTQGRGVSRMNPETGRFTHYVHDPTDPHSLSGNVIWDIFEDSRRQLWVTASDGGLNLFDPEQDRFIRYRHDPGDPGSISSNSTSYLYEDRSQVLWIGTLGGGISKLNLNRKPFLSYAHDPQAPNSLGIGNVMNVMEDRTGDLWIGTLGSGLNRLNRDTDRITYYKNGPRDPESISSQAVLSLMEDSNGMIWAGALEGGVNRINPQTGRVDRFTGSTVWSILEDRTGTIWLGGQEWGVRRLDPDTGAMEQYRHDPDDPLSLSSNGVYALLEDRTSRLWVGTIDRGLNLMDRSTGHFTHFQHEPGNPSSLSDNRIYVLYEDRAGRLWIGTNGGGLCLMNSLSDPEKITFSSYTIENGLQSNEITAIVEDREGHLWLGTTAGIIRVDVEQLLAESSESGSPFQLYDIHDGLLSNEVMQNSAASLHNGMIAFGMNTGLNLFDPERISPDPQPPPLVFTDFQLFNRSVPVETDDDAMLSRHISLTDEVVLDHSQSVFTIEFAALHYAIPEQNRYAYRMEGFDADWVQAGTRRFATYTNLDPGTYRFRVKGANHDGTWNEEGAVLGITVRPPLWQTWWAYMIYVVLLAGSITGYIRYHRSKLERETAMQRVSQELGIANRIQTSMLPNPASEVSMRDAVDIAAAMYPATEVGGDLYDYFMIDDHRLAIIIGDVSEKGIPASLFMAMSLSWLRSTTNQEVTPHACLSRVNRLLATDNDSAMFVTVFYGILDIRSGLLEYSNGGHVLPYLLSPGAEMPVQKLKNTGGLVLGAYEDVTYRTDRITLIPGQSLFLYSDGVTEAADKDDKLFTEARLETLLRNSSELPPQSLIAHVKKEIDDFSAGVDQSDDISVMAVRFLGPPRS